MTFEYTGYFHIYSISFLVVYAYFSTPTFYFILTKEKSSLDKLTTHCIKEKKSDQTNDYLQSFLSKTILCQIIRATFGCYGVVFQYFARC